MKYMKTLINALCVVVLFTGMSVSAAPSTNAVADVLDSPWTLSLAGGGSTALNNAKPSSTTTLGTELQLGRSTTVVFPTELGLRQNIGYSDVNGRNWSFGSKLYSDWTVIRLGSLQFDAGANIGVQYGNQSLKWVGGPEAVARLYLKKNIDVFLRAEYPFDIGASKAENKLTYGLGLRFRF